MKGKKLLATGAALAVLAALGTGVAAAARVTLPSSGDGNMWPSARRAETAAMTPARYAHAISRICSRAVLFTGRHQIGTRAGAIAVSRDIRSTGRRRLRRVQAVPKPPAIAGTAADWVATELELNELYAATYLRIWNQIEQAYAGGQRDELPLVLHRLVHRPDKLKLRAGRLEATLGVPDCTGGG